MLVARRLAVVAVGLATLALGTTLALAATPDTPYETLRVESYDPQFNGRFADRMDAAGDLDGDGVGDVWIAAYSLTVGDNNDVGRIWAMSGRTRQPLYRIDHPEPQNCQAYPGASLPPTFACGLGWSITNLGDINRDGVNDVGAAANRENVTAAGDPCTPPAAGCNPSQGTAYVFSGADGSLMYDLDNPEPQAHGYFGWISTAGDIASGDGSPGKDGVNEVLVGAFQNDVPAGCANQAPVPSGCRKDEGRAYIFNGATGQKLPEPRGTLEVPQRDRYLNPATGTCVSESRIITQQDCGGAGIVNEGVGDVDNDGFWDQSLTVWTLGIPQSSRAGSDPACWKTAPNCNARQGRIYIFSGRTGEIIRTLDDPVPQEGALFGLQIVEAGAPGDINGDGHDDIYGIGFMQDRTVEREGRAWVFSGANSEVLLDLVDPTPIAQGTFGYALAKTDYNRDGRPDLYIGSFAGSYVFLNNGELQKIFDLPPEDAGERPETVSNLGRSVAAPGDINGDGEPDYVAGAPGQPVNGLRNQGRAYAYLSNAPLLPPSSPPGGASPAPPALNPCGVPGAAGYLWPAKMRVSRARVLRKERRLDVLAPITSRARGGEVSVIFHADDRIDTFDEEVTNARTELDEIRILQRITRGQARLGTGIVTIDYQGDANTQPQLVRLRAASRPARLDVEKISLIGDRLAATGSVTSRAKGIVRFRFSYLDPDGSPNVHEARAKIRRDGDWELKRDQVPAQLARCGGYLSIQFTGYFPQRIQGEQLAYQLNPGQTRKPR